MPGSHATACGGATPCPCGGTIVQDYVMADDLLDCSSGLSFGNTGLTLDCNGHTIGGLGPSSVFGVQIPAYWGDTVRNCRITDFEQGVFLVSATYATVSNNQIVGNTFGAYLRVGSTNNEFWGNVFDNTAENAYEEAGATFNRWNSDTQGNFWSDFESNPGFPYGYYEIPGPGQGVDFLAQGLSRPPTALPFTIAFDDGLAHYEERNVIVMNEDRSTDLVVTHPSDLSISVTDSANLVKATGVKDNGNGTKTTVTRIKGGKGSTSTPTGQHNVTVTATNTSSNASTIARTNVTVVFNITVPNATAAEMDEWLRGANGTYYWGGPNSSSTVPLDPTNRLIVELAENVSGGAADPETAANRKQKWITDNAGWVPAGGGNIAGTDFCYPDAKTFLKKLRDAANSGTPTTAQCMDFCMALVAMLRAEGIPARPVTGHEVGDWNFHCWVEVYIPGRGWQAIDATPSGVSPNGDAAGGRGDYWDRHGYGNTNPPPGMAYTHEPTCTAIDLTDRYRNNQSTKPQTACTLGITVMPGQPAYQDGDTITFDVTYSNPTGSAKSFDYQIQAAWYSSLETRAQSNGGLLLRNVTGTHALIPGESVTFPYTIDEFEYYTSGRLRLSAFTDEPGPDGFNCHDLEDVPVASHLALVAQVPSTPPNATPPFENDPLEINFSLTNTGPTSLNGIAVTAATPFYSTLGNQNYYVPSLLPGESYNITLATSITRGGTWNFVVSAQALEGSQLLEFVPLRVLRPAALLILNTRTQEVSRNATFNITADVINPGDSAIPSNVTATLDAPAGLTVANPLSQYLGTFSAHQTKTATWLVNGSQPGQYVYRVTATEGSMLSDENWELLQVILPGGRRGGSPILRKQLQYLA